MINGRKGGSIMFNSNHWLIGVCVMEISDKVSQLFGGGAIV